MNRESDLIEFQVYRFDPEEEKDPYYIIYDVPYRRGMTVLDGLIWIIEELDSTLSLRYNCRFKACGSCAVLVNGVQRLACETQISNYSRVKVDPLPHFKVIKDLVVDMEPFLKKMDAIMPYLNPENLENQSIISPDEFNLYRSASDCIWCGSCTSTCPISSSQPYYLGPAALNQLYRFVSDSREIEGLKEMRLIIGDSGKSGVWRCHQVFACNNVCPKDIDPGNSIASLKKMIIEARLRNTI